MANHVQRFTKSLTRRLQVRRVRFDEKNLNYDAKKHDLTPNHNQSSRQRHSHKTFLEKRPNLAVLFAVATLFTILVLRSFLTLPVQQYETSSGAGQRYMQLVIPINRKSDVDLCKTILSAQVLNYPVPVIVPWGNSSDNTPVAKKKRMYSKVARIYAYLSTLPSEAEDAVTVLLDGPDTWFQLRPDMLLQAYYRILRRQNRKLRKSFADEIEQKVIFSAYHDCGSRNADDAVCQAVPDAPYEGGPRFLGHGAMVGQAKDIREIVRRALDKLELAPNAPPKLLPVYTEIFGEQESRRKRVQQSPTHNDWAAELGIGLDHYNELGLSVSAETFPKWETPRKLLRELEATMPPYWTVSGREPDLPHDTPWADVKLLTGYNDSLPAMIHHWPTVALGGKDATGNRKTWWSALWLTEHARALFTASERLPSTVVAQVHDDQGEELLFWNRQPNHNRMGAWTPDWKFSYWSDMCGRDEQWTEVFRDEAGPWRRTDFF
ncbi:hypothetical protein AC579_1435 [Pseudocercospora musae]|uniref:Uncharacterized protein n=1 Tax=Pseudocercospora musae TaxID=113226 RepID=A0A139IMD6_9PEZI|nr:hypothetical protein AC579_1435 [Pseudocercospora musae]